ncbi:DUF429 domain-containing protein [Shewanella sp. JM162201]|uniref:DUF429 domain-containing protein n=1 Tax=Shewanella jiangmenensis TaxID=2837387 RepID=A0ABS5V5H5_9GAMM|nr:DUF429 domain-containing protein [Shewanella jiangmenensis]MBT1444871.1 DUF429 domain-containing protein [Shewanella jiangmenensis]
MNKDTRIKLMGLDLSWQGGNCSGLATGTLQGSVLNLDELTVKVFSPEELLSKVEAARPTGIAIDAPLIINNHSSNRDCERLIGQHYGSRGASCHTSNLTLFPDALGVRLSKALLSQGYNHLAGPRWQIECYPHPALIEIFNLPYRLGYKKGKVAERRVGQIKLANHICSLTTRTDLTLSLPATLTAWIDPERINSLRGQALKHNEDGLDAIICLYIAARHQLGLTKVFPPKPCDGPVTRDYIVV